GACVAKVEFEGLVAMLSRQGIVEASGGAVDLFGERQGLDASAAVELPGRRDQIADEIRFDIRLRIEIDAPGSETLGELVGIVIGQQDGSRAESVPQGVHFGSSAAFACDGPLAALAVLLAGADLGGGAFGSLRLASL